MQAVLRKEIETNRVTIKERLENLFSNIETADMMTKNAIENDIVKMGATVANFLVDKVNTQKGVQRGIAAMSLIRIGEDAINPIKEKAVVDSDFQWIAQYLITEIKGAA